MHAHVPLLSHHKAVEEVSQELVAGFMLFLFVIAVLGFVMMMHQKMCRKHKGHSIPRGVSRRRPLRNQRNNVQSGDSLRRETSLKCPAFKDAGRTKVGSSPS